MPVVFNRFVKTDYGRAMPCLPEPLNSLWKKEKSKWIFYYSCPCYFTEFRGNGPMEGKCVGYYLKRKDNSSNNRIVLNFYIYPDGTLESVKITIMDFNTDEDYLRLNFKLSANDFNETLFKMFYEIKDKKRKQMSEACKYLAKYIRTQLKKTLIENDFTV